MNKWISVKDRLPEPEEQVLGCFEDSFIATISTDANGEWELWADSGKVTHWMKLPELPGKDTYESNLKTIIEHYGFAKQLEQLEEECGELIVAAQKLKCCLCKETNDNFLSEVADVAVCVDEMKLLFTPDKIEYIQIAKARRQINRIKEELKDDE